MKRIIYRKPERWTDCLPYDGYEITENGKRSISNYEIVEFLMMPHREFPFEDGWTLAETEK